MVKKRYVPKKRPSFQKNDNQDKFAEKITVQVYASVIICAIMLAISKVDGDFGNILRQKIKTAINADITFDEVKDVFDDFRGKIIDVSKMFYEDEISLKDKEKLNF